MQTAAVGIFLGMCCFVIVFVIWSNRRARIKIPIQIYEYFGMVSIIVISSEFANVSARIMGDYHQVPIIIIMGDLNMTPAQAFACAGIKLLLSSPPNSCIILRFLFSLRISNIFEICISMQPVGKKRVCCRVGLPRLALTHLRSSSLWARSATVVSRATIRICSMPRFVRG